MSAAECDRLRRENERFRAALERIASGGWTNPAVALADEARRVLDASKEGEA